MFDGIFALYGEEVNLGWQFIGTFADRNSAMAKGQYLGNAYCSYKVINLQDLPCYWDVNNDLMT